MTARLITRSTLSLVAALALAASAPVLAAWRLDEAATVTRSGEAMAPVMAPDGRRVAYVVGKRTDTPGAPAALRGRLWTLDREAGEAALLGRFPVEAVEGERLVAFAPSGRAYAYVEGRRAEPTLWYVDEKGDRLRLGSGRAASFGPDGTLLAYTVWDAGEQPAVELWLFEMATRESKRLARVALPDPLDLGTPADAPRWMPNAARIAFLAAGDVYAYARFTGRLEPLTRAGDVRSFDVTSDGGLWYHRGGADRNAAGIWSLRADGKVSMRVFRADELPSGISALTRGPDAATALFLADTAAGRGLVAADAKTGRWRQLADADAFSLLPGSRRIALESAGTDGRRNIVMGRLASDADRSPR